MVAENVYFTDDAKAGFQHFRSLDMRLEKHYTRKTNQRQGKTCVAAIHSR